MPQDFQSEPDQSSETALSLSAAFEWLHAHPELSGRELQTTRFLRQQLAAAGVRVLESRLATGLIAEVGDARRGRCVALRADIDALPIQEATSLAYASQVDGRMHACGHDLHTTCLLGAARELKAIEDQLPGRVLFLFQPAEEAAGGAEQMIATGLLDEVSAFVGLHNTPDLAPGQLSLDPGPVMAAVDQFRVEITGVGSHAAAPHTGVDAVLAISTIVNALQSVVARNVDPLKAAVLSVTHIEVGSTWNVLPDTGYFEGTLRSFSDTVKQTLNQRFTEVVEGVAHSMGTAAQVTWQQAAFAPTINDAALVALLRPALAEHFTLKPLPPSTGGEDFSAYAALAPAAFAKLGANGSPDAPAWHHSSFIAKQSAIQPGVDFYTTCAQALLEADR